jgi:N-acetyl-alpha-D-muramate 1-phosphate uridylyltransferase
MNAMILAAGRGERMRPLTDHCPKPLLMVGGKPLIVWHLERLASSGFKCVVINYAHLGGQIEAAIGDGQRWGLSIHYSAEPEGALETAGGIAQAIPLLGNAPFLVINGDVFCDWNPAKALKVFDSLGPSTIAHLILVPNPPQHPDGDFWLHKGTVYASTRAERQGLEPRHTFSGIGVYQPELFLGIARGSRAKLAPLLIDAMATNQVSGELHLGGWVDVGTPERLSALDASLTSKN